MSLAFVDTIVHRPGACYYAGSQEVLVPGRELNLMDVAIHELGREMLEDRMEEQREAAVLKPVRSPTDKKPPGGRRRERYEPSAGELAAALSSQLRIGSEPLLGPGERARCSHLVVCDACWRS